MLFASWSWFLLVAGCATTLVESLDDIDGDWSGEYQRADSSGEGWVDGEITLEVDADDEAVVLAYSVRGSDDGSFDLDYYCDADVPRPGMVRMDGCERTYTIYDDDGDTLDAGAGAYGDIVYTSCEVRDETLFLGTWILER